MIKETSNPWSTKEEELLKTEIGINLSSVSYTAKKLGRTETEVRAKLENQEFSFKISIVMENEHSDKVLSMKSDDEDITYIIEGARALYFIDVICFNKKINGDCDLDCKACDLHNVDAPYTYYGSPTDIDVINERMQEYFTDGHCFEENLEYCAAEGLARDIARNNRSIKDIARMRNLEEADVRKFAKEAVSMVSAYMAEYHGADILNMKSSDPDIMFNIEEGRSRYLQNRLCEKNACCDGKCIKCELSCPELVYEFYGSPTDKAKIDDIVESYIPGDIPDEYQFKLN